MKKAKKSDVQSTQDQRQVKRVFDAALLLAKDGKALLYPVGDKWCLASRMKKGKQDSSFEMICQALDLFCSESMKAGSLQQEDEDGVLEQYDITIAKVSRGETTIVRRSRWHDLLELPTQSLTPLAAEAVSRARELDLVGSSSTAAGKLAAVSQKKLVQKVEMAMVGQ